MKQKTKYSEKRNKQRIPINETGFLTNLDKKQETIPVRVTDVSQDGVGLLASRLFNTNQKYILKYSILNKALSIPVQVEWSDFSTFGNSLGCRKKPSNN